jgi:hypothetical protein
MIDADVVETEGIVNSRVSIADDLEDRAVRASTAMGNPEIQNIAPNRYLKTTDDSSGFECVDGGGDEGGKAGQGSIKKSDDNYDTIWGNILEVSSKGMTILQNAEFCKSNETHIFADEIDETGEAARFPRADLVNRQNTENIFAERNESYILRNEIEQIIGSNVTLATHENYGFVKLGDGINDDNGKISADGCAVASKENFGLAKIGDNIDESDGVISVQPIGVATSTIFGAIKLGEDFSLNANEEMEVVEIEDGEGESEMVIYDLAKMKIVYNGIVELEENIAIYRAFLNEDLVFSFHLDFEPEADFSFILEIISDGEHLIDFVEEIEGGIPGLNRGITRIKFTKLLGSAKWNAEVNVLEAPEPILLTPNYGDSVRSDLILSSNGSSWDPHSMMGADVGNVVFQSNPREVLFDFAKSVVVDSVYFYNNNTNALSLFELLGSNDKINWTRLLYKAGVVIDKNTATEKKGAFHYFKLRFSGEGNVRGIQLWGSIIDNNDSELILLTPVLGSNSAVGITITCSNLRESNLYNITAPSANSYAEVDKGSFSDAFIQYEFAEPKVANFLDMASHQDNTNRTARWFKLIASNDAENWDLLLERERQEDWKQCETRYFELENTTAYRYYRLVCSYTANSTLYWRISRFRLLRRESGTISFVNCLPPLVAANQDGYEISANSTDAGHDAFYLLDGNADTKWATRGGDHLGAWVKIKLPETTAFNAAYLQARSDEYYYQAPMVFKVQGSNDDETWVDLTYEAASWSQKEGKIFYWFNETPYLYYRLLVESVQSGSNAGLAEFQLGTWAKTYRRYLNKYDYVVPVLTSDNDNGYVVTASSYYNDTYRPYKAFNRQTGVDSKWITANGGAAGAWLKIELQAAVVADSFSVASPNEGYLGRMPSSFKIQGSNNDDSWVDLLSVASISWSSNERKFWDVENETAYKFYKLLFVANSESLAAIGDWGILKKYIVIEY